MNLHSFIAQSNMLQDASFCRTVEYFAALLFIIAIMRTEMQTMETSLLHWTTGAIYSTLRAAIDFKTEAKFKWIL